MPGTYASYPGSGGSADGATVAAGNAPIGSSVSSISVTYDVTLTKAIPPIFSFYNTTDATPIFLIGICTAYSTTGFTVTFNAPTDTADYGISYIVSGAV